MVSETIDRRNVATPRSPVVGHGSMSWSRRAWLSPNISGILRTALWTFVPGYNTRRRLNFDLYEAPGDPVQQENEWKEAMAGYFGTGTQRLPPSVLQPGTQYASGNTQLVEGSGRGKSSSRGRRWERQPCNDHTTPLQDLSDESLERPLQPHTKDRTRATSKQSRTSKHSKRTSSTQSHQQTIETMIQRRSLSRAGTTDDKGPTQEQSHE